MSDNEIQQARTDALNAILDDPATHKVVVAGPGTGKTHTYKELLARVEGPALAITFLTVLVKDLEESIGELATVRSFHGFCKQILYSDDIPGLSHRLHYYPAINGLFEEDLSITQQPTTSKDIEKALMNLDDTSSTINGIIRSGNYYDATGYTDGVYRVLLHMQEKPETVPKFEQVVVDEYQDFSKLEVELINEVAKQSATLVVGDDDQALYGFKHASANYIRELCKNPAYKKLELPYCSRCTEVIVDATNHVVRTASTAGLLVGRVPKPYLCYVPDKRSESTQYPKIVHAHCTVQNTRSPIMARYIAKRIRTIPAEHAEKSFEKGYPTVLIIGPKQFTKPIYDFLSEEGFTNLSRKVSEEQAIEPLDGYRLIMKNEGSRLGWRILIYCHKPKGWQSWVKSALDDNTELTSLVDEQYAAAQLAVVEVLRKLLDGQELDANEIANLEQATGLDIDSLKEKFRAIDDTDESEDMEKLLDDAIERLEAETPDTSKPSILVTSLLGSKGLQADYVFVAGLNNNHFPRNNSQPTNEEVCQLIVALTRTRKECHLLSCDRFGLSVLEPSIFMHWLTPYLEERVVNAASVRNL